jgi:thiosulfate dehydrogenase [quinone] large subunit
MAEQESGLRALGRTYALLPLRIFLGITFIYAGLDKLTDPHYLAGLGDPLSFTAMTQGVKGGSPVGALLGVALHAPTAFALAIAYGELAAGLGILLGLLGRIAAIGGALLNLSFFLTVSWQVTPYYLGNDLIYLMAWLPFVLAGTPYLSLDRWWALRGPGRARNRGQDQRQGQQEGHHASSGTARRRARRRPGRSGPAGSPADR